MSVIFLIITKQIMIHTYNPQPIRHVRISLVNFNQFVITIPLKAASKQSNLGAIITGSSVGGASGLLLLVLLVCCLYLRKNGEAVARNYSSGSMRCTSLPHLSIELL
jgi:hypothetical protein